MVLSKEFILHQNNRPTVDSLAHSSSQLALLHTLEFKSECTLKLRARFKLQQNRRFDKKNWSYDPLSSLFPDSSYSLISNPAEILTKLNYSEKFWLKEWIVTLKTTLRALRCLRSWWNLGVISAFRLVILSTNLSYIRIISL